MTSRSSLPWYGQSAKRFAVWSLDLCLGHRTTDPGKVDSMPLRGDTADKTFSFRELASSMSGKLFWDVGFNASTN